MPIYQNNMADVTAGARQLTEGKQKMDLERFLKGGKNADTGAYEPGAEANSDIAKTKGVLASEMAAAKEMKGDNSDLVNNGGSLGIGSLKIGGDPYAHLQGQAPKEAKDLIHEGIAAYKPINDQLDSTKATLDALNLGNSTGDKLALINEAKRSLAGSGGRAIGQMVSLLSGDRTMAGDAQKALNWLQNSPSEVTMTPSQRDAIREGVFSLIPQTEQQHQMVGTQLSQHAPALAPHYAGAQDLVASFTAPAQQKLNQLKQMQSDYTKQKASMPGSPVSNPAIANPNPTTGQSLMGFVKNLMGGGAGQAAPAQAAPAPAVDPGYQRYQELLKKAQGQ